MYLGKFETTRPVKLESKPMKLLNYQLIKEVTYTEVEIKM